MNTSSNKLDLDPKSFQAIASLAYNESGLQLVIEKSSMIQSRLRHRLKAVGATSFASYVEFIHSNQGASERKNMISALTTNVSHFFRERHHFDILTNKIFDRAIPKLKAGEPFRVWSAGCSNGQEAFSVLIALSEAFPDYENYDVKVLATDIDPNVIAFAKNAQYPERLVTGISPNLRVKYFEETPNGIENVYTVKESLRSKVFFSELNLMADWPMKKSMDVIFCRNVVIYFDQQTQNKLWPRFRNQLHQDGYLFLGHSERIADPSTFGFEAEGPTTYRPTNRAVLQ